MISKEPPEKTSESSADNPNAAMLPIFLSLGIAIGTSLGVATGNIGVGIALGVAIGCSIGVALAHAQRQDAHVKNRKTGKTNSDT